jgi:hypothetical protein
LTLQVLQDRARAAKKQKPDEQTADEHKEDEQKAEALEIGVAHFPSNHLPQNGNAVFCFITTSASCNTPKSRGSPSYKIIGVQCLKTDADGRLHKLLAATEGAMMMPSFPPSIKALPYNNIKVDFAILERTGDLANRYAHLGLPSSFFFGVMCFSPVPSKGAVDKSPLVQAKPQGHILLTPYTDDAEHSVSCPAR